MTKCRYCYSVNIVKQKKLNIIFFGNGGWIRDYRNSYGISKIHPYFLYKFPLFTNTNYTAPEKRSSRIVVERGYYNKTFCDIVTKEKSVEQLKNK